MSSNTAPATGCPTVTCYSRRTIRRTRTPKPANSHERYLWKSFKKRQELPIEHLRRRWRRIVQPFLARGYCRQSWVAIRSGAVLFGCGPALHPRTFDQKRSVGSQNNLADAFASCGIGCARRGRGRPRPRHVRRRLPQLRRCYFQLELTLGVGIIRAADHDWFPDNEQCVATDFDLPNYRRRCPGVVPGVHIQVADITLDHQHQLVAVLSELSPDVGTDVEVLKRGHRVAVARGSNADSHRNPRPDLDLVCVTGRQAHGVTPGVYDLSV